MTESLKLGKPIEGAFSLFLQAQFRTSPLWPASDTNLKGKVAIVTGSSSGLGLEASRQLLSFGLSRLIIAVRSTERGNDVATKFRKEFPDAVFDVWQLEMSSYDSIQAFVRRCDSELPRLDIVILNAGVQGANFEVVPSTGHEKLVQVNYLSTMLLAILLLPVLKTKSPKGEPGRLSIVNSGSARGASISEAKGASVLAGLDDQSRPWKPVERYAVSKLLGHLFMVNLAPFINPNDVIVNLVDPGLTKNTNLQGFAPSVVAAFFYCFKAIFGRTVQEGASTYLDAAIVKGKESHGSIVANWRISQYPAFVYTPEGEAIREQLWKDTMAEFEFAGVQNILDAMKK